MDGTKFTAVESAVAVDGTRLKTWLTTREPGTYVACKVNSVDDRANLTVCQMSAPGLQYPHPAPAPGYETKTEEATSAIVIVGLRGDLDIDSIGPASRVTALMSSLQH